MSDFAGQAVTSHEIPPFLSTYSRYSALCEARISGGPVAAQTASWASANQARYYPFSIPFAYPVARVFWVNGTTASSNVCFGIYTTDGARLYSTGSTAQSGASVPQFVTPASPLWLPPGDYFFGFNCDGTSNRVWGSALAFELQRFAGIQQQAVGAVTLPDPATFAAASVNGANLCGVTWTDSGF